jgi:SAM-dependent methyltransferase
MDYERAVDQAPPGWRHFEIKDLERLPPAVRTHEIKAVPRSEQLLFEQRDPRAVERVMRAFFWTLVYHLEPDRWDALAQIEPIHPEVIAALCDVIASLPASAPRAIDIGAGSGRLTQHMVGRCGHVIAIEPAAGLRARIKERFPTVETIAGWAEALPLADGCSNLTAACSAVGPQPEVLTELERVTAIGGVMALISPEDPEWFDAHGWSRFTFPPQAPLAHPAWIEEFFGPLECRRDLFTKRATG